MENKIKELTDKIYREGVEKGNEEAQRLIANAQEEAKKIIEDCLLYTSCCMVVVSSCREVSA